MAPPVPFGIRCRGHIKLLFESRARLLPKDGQALPVWAAEGRSPGGRLWAGGPPPDSERTPSTPHPREGRELPKTMALHQGQGVRVDPGKLESSKYKVSRHSPQHFTSQILEPVTKLKEFHSRHRTYSHSANYHVIVFAPSCQSYKSEQPLD